MLEDYFDFWTPDDIRLKGSRIGIESILYEHLYHAQSPETIQAAYPSLTLDQVYATILYYLRNKPSVERYLTEWVEFGRRARAEQDQNPQTAVKHLRALKAKIEAANSSPEQFLQSGDEAQELGEGCLIAA
jgi:uncharacterized protein (DUF433 family)